MELDPEGDEAIVSGVFVGGGVVDEPRELAEEAGVVDGGEGEGLGPEAEGAEGRDGGGVGEGAEEEGEGSIRAMVRVRVRVRIWRGGERGEGFGAVGMERRREESGAERKGESQEHISPLFRSQKSISPLF